MEKWKAMPPRVMFSDPIILSTSFGLGYATILILPKSLIINNPIIIFLFSIPKHIKSTSLIYSTKYQKFFMHLKWVQLLRQY